MQLDITYALVQVLLLWVLTVPHEFSHAWVAERLGDDTPRREGRVTLYPLAHVDWIGTALLPFITSLLGGGFLGWGKPVRSDPRKLRGGLNGLALVALAGPASNVVLSVVLAILARATLVHAPAVADFFSRGVRLSLYLAILNMLPLPYSIYLNRPGRYTVHVEAIDIKNNKKKVTLSYPLTVLDINNFTK